jgi:hypothetical protein
MKLLAPKFVVLPFVVAVTALSVTTAPSQATTAHAGGTAVVATKYAYQGDAYGTKVNVGNTVTSGASAPVVLPCGTTAGIHLTNTVAGVSLPPLINTGTIDTTADTFASPTKTKTSATVQNLSLLNLPVTGGVITATEVRSVSSTSHDGSGFHTSAAGTSFTSLQVAGIPITGNVAPNTQINLVGFGYVVLNEQIRKVRTASASLTVNAVHVVINQSNALDIPIGTNIIVAHARSALRGPVAGTLDGFAYGSRAKLGSVVTSGPSFRVVLPCLGTNGNLKVNDGAGISVPGVLVTGAIHNTAQGTINGSAASGETTSTVDSANVVSGLVQATAIKADAHASTDGTTFTFSDAGSSFATLSVQGFPEINEDVPANTKVHIPGLGKLWLHRVIHTPNSIEVRMIELIVTHSNTLGLPVGSDIQVAVAHASAH